MWLPAYGMNLVNKARDRRRASPRVVLRSAAGRHPKGIAALGESFLCGFAVPVVHRSHGEPGGGARPDPGAMKLGKGF